MSSSQLIFLGTYTREGAARGIYASWLDGESGALSRPELVADVENPTWLALSPDLRFLYANHANASQAIAFAVDRAAGRLEPLVDPHAANPAGNASPALGSPSHLAMDATGRVLLAANYHQSFVASIPIHSDGTLGSAHIIRHEGKGTHPTRQEKPHPHSVTLSPDNRFVIVADLGLDRIFSYALDIDAGRLAPADPPFVSTSPGDGPRHFKFSPDGTHAYAINELSNTITVFDYDPVRGALSPRQKVPTLPVDSRTPTSRRRSACIQTDDSCTVRTAGMTASRSFPWRQAPAN
jgi:6-phosphogluconolactonase